MSQPRGPSAKMTWKFAQFFRWEITASGNGIRKGGFMWDIHGYILGTCQLGRPSQQCLQPLLLYSKCNLFSWKSKKNTKTQTCEQLWAYENHWKSLTHIGLKPQYNSLQRLYYMFCWVDWARDPVQVIGLVLDPHLARKVHNWYVSPILVYTYIYIYI